MTLQHDEPISLPFVLTSAILNATFCVYHQLCGPVKLYVNGFGVLLLVVFDIACCSSRASTVRFPVEHKLRFEGVIGRREIWSRIVSILA